MMIILMVENVCLFSKNQNIEHPQFFSLSRYATAAVTIVSTASGIAEPVET